MLVWVWTVALAQTTPPGHLALETSPHAAIQVLPRTRIDQIDLAVYGNRVPLEPQLEGLSPPHVLSMDVRSIGGGTWFVSLLVDRPSVEVTLSPRASGYVLALRPGAEVPRLVDRDPSYEEVVAGTAVRRPSDPIDAPLTFLQGDASPVVLDVRRYALGVPEWEPRELPEVEAIWLRPAPSTPDQIARYRRVLTESGSARARQVAAWRLARAYLDVGLTREARYYLARVAEAGPYAPQGDVSLWQAQAALGTGLLDEARQHCRAAARAGVARARVLECLGVVSLATSDPPPGAVGRLFAPYATAPEEQVLAAELLLRDGDWEGARPLLEAAAKSDSDVRSLALANLGDVDLVAGELEGASRSWMAASLDPRLAEVAAVRAVLSDLVAEGPTGWAAAIPWLERQGSGVGPGSAEALYLLAQIGHRYGDPDTEVDALVKLMRRHPAVSARGDVPERLLATCVGRLSQLQRSGQHVQNVAFFRGCWDPGLDTMVRDTGPLEGVARSLVALGLREEALDVQRHVLAIHTHQDREDVGALVTLAELYAATRRDTEALDTVTYTERLRPDPAARDRLAVVRGDALRSQGRPGDALAAYPRAPSDPAVALAAARGRALAQLDRDGCGPARRGLEEVADRDHDVALALVRCLVATDPAQAVARGGALKADPEIAPDADWLMALASVAGGGLPDAPVVAHPLWKALLEEEAAAASLDEEVRRHR